MRIDFCPQCGFRLDARSTEQNAKLHALLHDIAEQKQWAGQKLDVEAWKRLMTAAWARATGRNAEMYPALDGQGFDVVYRRTSRMSKSEMVELIEYATAWAVENGVRLHEPQETVHP